MAEVLHFLLVLGDGLVAAPVKAAFLGLVQEHFGINRLGLGLSNGFVAQERFGGADGQSNILQRFEGDNVVGCFDHGLIAFQ